MFACFVLERFGFPLLYSPSFFLLSKISHLQKKIIKKKSNAEGAEEGFEFELRQ
jgi:hypothetical protein